jgi:hypothetical protein
MANNKIPSYFMVFFFLYPEYVAEKLFSIGHSLASTTRQHPAKSPVSG